MRNIFSLSSDHILLASLLVAFLLIAQPQVHAANYPLEIINAEETGVNNRIRFAYPGIEYRVRLFAHGGKYPFAWELTANTTCEATIDSSSGVITWSSPTMIDSGCTIEAKVTDFEASTDTESYTVAVTSSTSRFIWLDASNSAGGRDGSYTNPYQNFSDFWEAGGHGGKIVYLREGGYDFSGIAGDNARGRGAYRILHSPTNHPTAFLAYPGEVPRWSGTRGFAGNNSGKHFFGGSPDLYFYGINFTNQYSYMFEIMQTNYSVWHDNVFDDYVSATGYQNDGNISWYNVGNSSNIGIGGNQFLGGTGDWPTAIKHYNVHYQVVEGNIFQGYSTDMAISLKHNSTYNAIRANEFRDNNIDIGFAGYEEGTSENEVCFNYSTGSTYTTIYINRAEQIGTNHIYRNTLLGRLLFRNVNNGVGPIYINDNVIVNNDNNSSITPQIRENLAEHYSITAEAAITSNNLMGNPSNNLVTTDGLLTPNNSNSVGSTGWQFSDGSTPTDATFTPPPTHEPQTPLGFTLTVASP